MTSIQKNNRAAELLAALTPADGLSLERVALLSGLTPEQVRACSERKTQLAPDAQVAIARTIAKRVPRLARAARQLEQQALAAGRMSLGSTATHKTAPAKWW